MLGRHDVVQRSAGPDGGGYGPLAADPAGLLALPAGFSYGVVSRSREGIALAGRSYGVAAVDPGRGHRYLAGEAGDTEGALHRWGPAAGGPQGFRCFDSGGRFVGDLGSRTRVGTVLGVDWPDVGAGGVGRFTRMGGTAGLWWGDGGVYVCLAGTADGGGALWVYRPSRRTLTLKALLGAGRDVAPEGFADGAVLAPGGGLVTVEGGAGRRRLLVHLEGRACPLARLDLNLGTERAPRYGAFAGAARSADGRTLFAGVQEPGITLAITGPWHERPQGCGVTVPRRRV